MEQHRLTRRALLRLTGGMVIGAILEPKLALAAQEKMILRKIPLSGETLPVVGIGSYQTFDVTSLGDRNQVREVLRLFAAMGGRLVDSSPMYGAAESVIGDVTTQLDLNRQFFLATKVWTSGREAGIQQAEQSMTRLRSRQLDLLQVHNLLDVDTHLPWLKDWKAAGKIRYVGVTHYQESSFSALEKYVSNGHVDFVQLNYSMAERAAEDRLLPAALASGTAVIVNRPFADAALFEQVKGRTLPEWAAEFDAATWAQFFLKYILAHPAVTSAIPATRNPKHVLDNMSAGVGRLPDEAMRKRMLAHLNSPRS
jgi:diketogulonate reductase-like aldo/keto reductase